MAGLLQFKRTTSATVMETFSVDGTPTDLDSGVPAVTITKPDGTTIASGTVSNSWAGPPPRSTGQYRFVLAGQPECTLLTVTWAGTIGGQPQTLEGQIEIVGALLFNIADLRALRVAGSQPFALGATPLYTDAQIMGARAATLDEFEQILGFSPVPRFARETVDGDGLWSVILPHLKCHRLISVTINGVAQSIGSYTLRRSGVLEATSGYVASGTFTAGRQNVVAEYVHGETRVMGDGDNMAMMVAAAKLLPSGFSSAQTVTTPDGVSYTYEPSETGRGGFVRHTGIREVDRWLNRHSQAGLAVA